MREPEEILEDLDRLDADLEVLAGDPLTRTSLEGRVRRAIARLKAVLTRPEDITAVDARHPDYGQMAKVLRDCLADPESRVHKAD